MFDYWPLQRLDKATSTIDTVVACVRRQIELLREYRARLIADAVTGKLDVREAAAGLPDEGDIANVEPLGIIDNVTDNADASDRP